MKLSCTRVHPFHEFFESCARDVIVVDTDGQKSVERDMNLDIDRSVRVGGGSDVAGGDESGLVALQRDVAKVPPSGLFAGALLHYAIGVEPNAIDEDPGALNEARDGGFCKRRLQ